MPTIELAAGPIEYTVLGPDDGHPTLLLHALLVDRSVWGDLPRLLAEAGLRVIAPTWPLGSHRLPMTSDADLSLRGQARLALDLLAALDLTDVTLVGNDTGGAVVQFVVTEDATRIGSLVLTNCDAFEVCPPFPFTMLVRLLRHPAAARSLMGAMRWGAFRCGPLGFGTLARSRLTASRTRSWVLPYLQDAAVREDTARFARSLRPGSLLEISDLLAGFTGPVLLPWGVEDRYFTPALARRLAAAFPDARLHEIHDARTIVALDQPQRLAEAIVGFVDAR